MYNRLKKLAESDLVAVQGQAEYLDEVDEIGDTAYCWKGRKDEGKRLRRGGRSPGHRHAVPDGDAKKLELVE